MATESRLGGGGEYKYGFVTEVEKDRIPKGLNEEVIRTISEKKNEPEFLLNFRLKAYQKWLTMEEPRWANVAHPLSIIKISAIILHQRKNLN